MRVLRVTRRRAMSAVVLVLGIGVGLMVGTAPAVSAAPASVTLSGHGWGHGRGMGQFGAQGYATLPGFGWNSAQILDHFYSNTGAASLASGQLISVRLVAQDGIDLLVTSNSPFSVAGYNQPAGAAVAVTTDASGNYVVQGFPSCNGGGTNPPVPVADPVVAESLAGDPGNDLNKMLTICGGPTYRGALRFVIGDSLKRTVNIVGVEDYLRGVVPRESPSSFATAALEAQAIAARSYAMAQGGESGQRYTYAKTCDTTSCQVYGGAGLDGVRREANSTDAAVANTAGLVRRFGDSSLASTEFSSSTGGWTAGGAFPAVVDDGDAVSSNPRHNWQTSISTSALTSAYGLGSFVDLQVTQRNSLGDWGGRVLKISVIGSQKTVSLSGAQFESDWGLFSDWFTTDTTNGPGTVSTVAGGVSVFARGGDGGLWVRAETAGGLGSWKSLGGTLASDPDASSWGGGRVDVFARGVDSALWHRWSADGVTWSAWESLGGVLLSSPTAVAWGPNRIDVFGKGSDGALWGKTYSSGWSSWYSLGGGLTGDPDVSSWAPGRLDVFIRGQDNALWHRGFTGAGWDGWQSLGGTLTSGPGAASWGPNRIDVFARSTDGGLWTRSWTGVGWTGWSPLGGALASDPDVATSGVNKLDVVVRGLDAAIWQRSWNGSTWSNWFTIGPPA
jgi:SpoIID/LytB domain protein